VQVLSLPSGVSRSKDDIPSARCRSYSLSDRFCSSFFIIFHLKLYNSIQKSSCNKFNFQAISSISVLVCDILCVVTWIITSRNDLGYD
jgi:hypothetical protein